MSTWPPVPYGEPMIEFVGLTDGDEEEFFGFRIILRRGTVIDKAIKDQIKAILANYDLKPSDGQVTTQMHQETQDTIIRWRRN